ncbi:hypothetical protein EGJ50_02785 [Pseudomonas luteola]|nr:hypothetical protein EGJ50_02785 [Pseudomonas luteola]
MGTMTWRRSVIVSCVEPMVVQPLKLTVSNRGFVILMVRRRPINPLTLKSRGFTCTDKAADE